uniref:3CxxC-type domain-containing protein n=1 Tax=Prolemur simus TaxID=1328070 RepID=A0A8C9AHY9_PROSS
MQVSSRRAKADPRLRFLGNTGCGRSLQSANGPWLHVKFRPGDCLGSVLKDGLSCTTGLHSDSEPDPSRAAAAAGPVPVVHAGPQRQRRGQAAPRAVCLGSAQAPVKHGSVPGRVGCGGPRRVPLTSVSLPRRLQCSLCRWAWSSAHVHLPFHLCWDGDSWRGLVKMRVWGQRCQLCAPPCGNCHVSPLNIHILLSRLVLHILQKCCGDTLGPDQCPEMRFGGRCEACDLGVSFLQGAPDPAWGPLARSPTTAEGRRSGNEGRLPVAALGSSSCVSRATAPPTHDFLSEGYGIVAVPFSLVDTDMDQGPVAHGCASPGGSSLPAAGSEALRVLAAPEGKGIVVDVRDPIFQGRGHLSEVKTNFELPGFLFKAGASPWGVLNSWSRVCPVTGQDALSDWSVRVSPDWSVWLTLPETAVDTPTTSGEHLVTFPFTFTKDADAIASVAESNGKEGGHQGFVTAGHDLCPETNASGLTSKDKSSLAASSFPDDIRGRDSFIDVTEGREKEDGTSTHGRIWVRGDSVTNPFSALEVISKGPGNVSHGPQNNGLVTYDYYRKRWLRSRLGKSSRGGRREANLGSGRACRRPCAELYEDVWIWVSLTLCILWLLCMCRLNPGIFPQPV